MRYRRVIAWSTHTFEDIRGEIESIPVITVIREVIDHIDSLTADSSDSSGTSGKPPQRRTRFNELKKQAARVLIRMAETVARVELTDLPARQREPIRIYWTEFPKPTSNSWNCI
ncbi:hypothetical protein EBR96_06925 [bacterium]|nr:hypothetical protein [bacterium]